MLEAVPKPLVLDEVGNTPLRDLPELVSTLAGLARAPALPTAAAAAAAAAALSFTN